ncbi:MAG: hypothetical protein KGQ66_23330 [Acidobacteriota bacterium]|nr:hypothetical protein [Acidobacteriota bacterium]
MRDYLWGRAFRLLLASTSVAALTVAAVASSGVGPAAAANSPYWSSLSDVAAGTTTSPHFLGVSCVGAGDCLAVGQETGAASNGLAGVYSSETQGIWATTARVAGPGTGNQGLAGVSCASLSSCVAVGNDGNDKPLVAVGSITGVGSGTEISLAGGANGILNGVSCTGAGSCSAIGTDFTHEVPLTVSETGGTWGTPIELAGMGGLATGLLAVSCYSPGNCTAVGTNLISSTNASGIYAVETGGVWGTPTSLADSPGLPANVELTGVSCVSAGNCTAVGDTGGATSLAVLDEEIDGVWGGVIALTNSPGTSSARLDGVSCVSAGNCTASGVMDPSSGSGAEPLLAIEVGVMWYTIQPGSFSPSELNGVSCYGPGDCTAAGFERNTGTVDTSTPLLGATVGFVGGPAQPTVTVSGLGFGSSIAVLGAGSAPCGPLSTGLNYLDDLYIQDVTQGWTAGAVSAVGCDYTGLQVLSYSDTRIVFSLGSSYPTYGPLAAGDSFVVHVFGNAIAGTVAYSPTVSATQLTLRAGGSIAAQLTGSQFVAGASVRVSGPSGLVSASSVSVSGPSSLTLTLSAPVNAAPGAYDLTVVNPDGTSGTCTGCLTVTPPPPVCSQRLPSGTVVGMADTADGGGYWIASSTGLVSACGDAPSFGNGPAGVAAITAAPSGDGYWLATTGGQVSAYGSAVDHGGLKPGTVLNKPIVAMAADPATGGYWLLGGDGGVFSFNAPFLGSTGNIRLNQPAVGLESTSAGDGYWFVASDGGIFAFGNAPFQGSLGNIKLNKPVVGMAIDPVTGGYWMDASDGGIFSFNAPFEGSTGNVVLAQPCVGMAASPGGGGYRFVAADGGIFDFNAPYEGSAT